MLGLFFEEILYIFRPLREKMASRKTEVRGLVGRPMLSPEYDLFLCLRWGGWNFLVGLLGLVLTQIPARKKINVLFQACHGRVDREIRAIFTQACTNVTRLRV